MTSLTGPGGVTTPAIPSDLYYVHHNPLSIWDGYYPYLSLEGNEDTLYAPLHSYTRFSTSEERELSPPAQDATSSASSSRCVTPVQPIQPQHTTTRLVVDVSLPTFPRTISPGVLSDGSKTIDYPPVQRVLAEPHLGRKHPLLADRVTEALVILAVMRRPDHPLHLVYWDGSREEKNINSTHYDKTLGIWQGLRKSFIKYSPHNSN
jgi:hypothetical protein